MDLSRLLAERASEVAQGEIRMSYIRSTDGAEMIEMGPHQYVNRAVLARLGYRKDEQDRTLTEDRPLSAPLS
jgi:hypothetical protein